MAYQKDGFERVRDGNISTKNIRKEGCVSGIPKTAHANRRKDVYQSKLKRKAKRKEEKVHLIHPFAASTHDCKMGNRKSNTREVQHKEMLRK